MLDIYHPKRALQTQRANPVLLTSDVPHRFEAERQEEMCVLKKGARENRCSVMLASYTSNDCCLLF